MPYFNVMAVELFDLARYGLNLHALAPVGVGFLVATLGVLVLLRERASSVSITFFGMALAGAVWMMSYGGIYCSLKPSLALEWAKIENVGVVFIPSLVYLFTLSVTGQLYRLRFSGVGSLLLSGLFAFTVVFTDLFVSGVWDFPWGHYARYGPWSLPFLAYFLCVSVASLLLLGWQYRCASSFYSQKRRLRAFLLAFGIAYLGSVDYLPAYGVPVYPAGYLPILICLAILAHTIWRYRLIDITPAFAANQILKTLSDALLVIDRDGIVQVVNQAACELFDRAEADFIGQPIWAIQGRFFPPEKFQTFVRAQVVHNYEVALSSKGGKRIVLEVAVSGIRDRFGDPMAVVCIARDVSERNQDEVELRRAHEALKKAHQELKAAQMSLIQAAKMESVGRLAAGVAHEVKNPLAVILQGLDYLDGHLASKDEGVSMVLQDGKDAVRRADGVVRGLLDFSSTKEIEMREESLNSVIEQSLLLVKHDLARNRISLVLDLEEGLPAVRIDRNKIEQVFINLFINAIHAMPEGGTLQVRTYSKQMEKLRVIAQVEDAGVGIPKEALAKIFDPFFTTKPTGKGTGLGLAVSKNILELHGGRIEVRNREEGGVQVILRFNAGGNGGGD